MSLNNSNLHLMAEMASLSRPSSNCENHHQIVSSSASSHWSSAREAAMAAPPMSGFADTNTAEYLALLEERRRLSASIGRNQYGVANPTMFKSVSQQYNEELLRVKARRENLLAAIALQHQQQYLPSQLPGGGRYSNGLPPNPSYTSLTSRLGSLENTTTASSYLTRPHAAENRDFFPRRGAEDWARARGIMSMTAAAREKLGAAFHQSALTPSSIHQQVQARHPHAFSPAADRRLERPAIDSLSEEDRLFMQRCYIEKSQNAVHDHGNSSDRMQVEHPSETTPYSAQKTAQEPSANNTDHPSSLTVPTDIEFLNEMHCFIRSTCIELFAATQDHVTAPGKGARPFKIGQVGLRCIHCKHVPRKNQSKQAVCYPSTKDNVYESIRNFQRMHMGSCQFIPENVQELYSDIMKRGNAQKKSQKIVKAYYAQSAGEVGLVDTPNGLKFRDQSRMNNTNRNLSTSDLMTKVMQAAEASSASSASQSSLEKAMSMGKFEHVVSAPTGKVILDARREPTAFVQPQDFPVVSDYIFLLFHQLVPCNVTPSTYRRRGIKVDPSQPIPGLCCKHCARTFRGEKMYKGMYFPLDVDSLADSSFTQTLAMHVMTCSNVPQDFKAAFSELKSLAKERSLKRGAKRKFMEKIWSRMENYYKRNSDSEIMRATAPMSGP